ncbi:MAG: hypothetical protein ACKV2U_33030 [Bryobacteraceae bacterium]
MITNERKTEIARENGAKSKGPKTEEGKEKCARNAITHGERAQALRLIVPPHSACLANEDRQAFYKMYDDLRAKYRPADETEQQLVREIAGFQWKSTRNKQMESAIFNRELMRQATRTPGTLPELRDLEISVAAQEALTGNSTIAELRKDTCVCLRAIAQLQHRLLQLQKNWPAAAPVPPAPEKNDIDERTDPNRENTAQTYDINGPVTPSVINLYREIFHKNELDLVGREPTLAATEPRPSGSRPKAA